MIELYEVTKSYYVSENKENVVLNKVSFCLPSKGFFFITGKSGCGKSTLLNIIAGFIKTDSGDVFIDEKNISKLKDNKLNDYIRNDIGIIFQKYNLFEDLSVEENLEIAISIKGLKERSKLDELLGKYNLKDKMKSVVKTLSGGEKQRLALIRAIINNPTILLCDEPTGALDKENGIKLMDELKEISQNSLVICVTHNEAFVENYADGFITLKDGKIIEKHLPTIETNEINKDYCKRKIPKQSSKFEHIITAKNIKKNAKLNLINGISSTFSILVFLLSLFFRNGILSNKENFINSFGDAYTFSLAKEQEQEIKDSNINLVRSERPKRSDVENLFSEDNVILMNAYDYLFSSEKTLVCADEKFSNFEFRPVVNLKLQPNEIIVNDKFIEEFQGISGKDIINKEVALVSKVNYAFYIKENNENVLLNFEIKINFVVKEVKNEFQYLRESRIYFNNDYLEQKLKEQNIKEVSVKTGKDFSVYDLVNSSSSTDNISSFKLYAFACDEKSQRNLMNIRNNTNLIKISNNGSFIVDSFADITASLFTGLLVLLSISLFTSLFTAGFLAFTSAVKNRKESAILSSLGASKNSIIGIYLKEQIFFSLSGVLFGSILTYFASILVNLSLNKFFVISNLINPHYLIVLISALFFSSLFYLICLFPLLILKRRNIYSELKEE